MSCSYNISSDATKIYFTNIPGPASHPLPAWPGLRPGEADLRLEVGRHQLRQGDQGEEGQAAALHGRTHLPGELSGLRGRQLYRAGTLLQRGQGLQ